MTIVKCINYSPIQLDVYLNECFVAVILRFLGVFL